MCEIVVLSDYSLATSIERLCSLVVMPSSDLDARNLATGIVTQELVRLEWDKRWPSNPYKPQFIGYFSHDEQSVKLNGKFISDKWIERFSITWFECVWVMLITGVAVAKLLIPLWILIIAFVIASIGILVRRYLQRLAYNDIIALERTFELALKMRSKI